ncbi:hypothetical protein [Sphingomonas sp. NIC1]|uniref:hypothetical protein n=1 Tax=Sphingomonas sp. NIC1 TaxID=1961362 RepID=UPI0007C0D7CE|nr:hypothetical protein [Sphingomonas sp. NIC1]ANC85450.1 hypothetical protein A7E77_00185 [Sphingomonas sp. NIC1]
MTTQQTKVDALRCEIERQCSIGAGNFYVDAGFGQSGLWQITADLDPAGLAAALDTPSPELTARMVAFVRVVANCTPTEGSEVDRLIVENARAFMAELDPVDGDRNEAERIAYDMEGALPRDLVEAGIKAGRKMEADERNAALKRKWDDAHGSSAIAGRALAEAGK